MNRTDIGNINAASFYSKKKKKEKETQRRREESKVSHDRRNGSQAVWDRLLLKFSSRREPFTSKRMLDTEDKSNVITIIKDPLSPWYTG